MPSKADPTKHAKRANLPEEEEIYAQASGTVFSTSIATHNHTTNVSTADSSGNINSLPASSETDKSYPDELKMTLRRVINKAARELTEKENKIMILEEKYQNLAEDSTMLANDLSKAVDSITSLKKEVKQLNEQRTVDKSEAFAIIGTADADLENQCKPMSRAEVVQCVAKDRLEAAEFQLITLIRNKYAAAMTDLS